MKKKLRYDYFIRSGGQTFYKLLKNEKGKLVYMQRDFMSEIKLYI